MTLRETSVERLDPQTEGFAEHEPITTAGTITRIGQGGFGPETFSIRLDTGMILSMSGDHLT